MESFCIKTTGNQIKHVNIQLSKLRLSSLISVFLQIVYLGLLVFISLLCVRNVKCRVFIPSHFHQTIPTLFPIPKHLE